MTISRCPEANVSVEKEIQASGDDDSSEQNEEKAECSTVIVPGVVGDEEPEDTAPDGGLIAWLQVLGSFALYFNTWGIINTFGVFQTYYSVDLLSHMSPSAISWIGSTQSFFLLVIGVISGPLYDAGHLRLLLGTGAALTVVGLMLTSIATEYWHVILSQAVCVGIGAGCLYVPSLAIIPLWFRRRKALALGTVTSGSSFGGVIYSLMFQGLQPHIGFGWTVRIMGFIALATLAIPLIVLRKRTHPNTTAAATTTTITTVAPTAAVVVVVVVKISKGGKENSSNNNDSGISSGGIRTLLDLDAFRDRSYVLYCAAMAFGMFGFNAPVFYLQPYAAGHGLGSRPDLALRLVSVFNAASVPGRIAPSFLAGGVGPAHALFLGVLLTGASVLAWGVDTRAGWGSVAFAVAYGFFSGGIVALPAVVLTSFTADLSRLGTRLGMSAVFNAVCALVGAPIAGAILGATGSYRGIQLYAGLSFMATALLVLVLRFAITGPKLFVKA